MGVVNSDKITPIKTKMCGAKNIVVNGQNSLKQQQQQQNRPKSQWKTTSQT